jgi:peptide/nickel transport system permease protein
MSNPNVPATTPVAGPPPPSAIDAEALTTKERSQLQMVLTRFMRHRLAVGSLVVFLLIVAFAFIGPLLWKWDHQVSLEIPSNTPWFSNADHPLGTTTTGHDVMGRLMRGTQQSLKVVFTVALLSTLIAAIWGAVAGFYRGWVDSLMMRIVDVVLTVPLLVLVIALAANVRGGTSWYSVAFIIAAVSWAGTSRVVRAVVLSLREQEFIEAARAMGASDTRIVFRHLIPNVTGPLIVSLTLAVAVTVLVEAALSFLGFGIKSPDTSLGIQIQEGLNAAFTRPWLFYPPGILLILIALTANFVGDGLRDALDPRQTMVRR